MNTVRLGDVCQQARESIRPGERQELRYIGLESIESGTGMFVEGELSKTPEIPLANSFRFGPEHVLYGKLRPYLNKVALPDFEGKCSTEIIPLLPSADVDRAYLGYFLRSKHVVDLIAARTAGARMPRADMDFVFSLPLPLPPLPEQRRIIDLLSRAEGIIRLRREAQQKAAELIPSLFLDMFGDPATNPKGWRTARFDEVVSEFRYGTNQKCHDHQADGDVAVLRIPNVIGGQIDWSDLKFATLPEKELAKTALRAGDVLFVRTNGNPEYIGRCAMFERNRSASYASYLIRARLTADLVPSFAVTHFNHARYRHLVVRAGRTTAGNFNLSTEGLGALPVIVPPLPLQTAFAKQAQRIEAIARTLSAATAKAEIVAAALSAEVLD